jgi:hypothetical protein
MATERQLQLERAFRQALRELGAGVSTEFLIAAASERTQADPGEIIEASRSSIANATAKTRGWARAMT